jgi:hypothetical protein
LQGSGGYGPLASSVLGVFDLSVQGKCNRISRKGVLNGWFAFYQPSRKYSEHTKLSNSAIGF